ncbi:hypothetical protein D027_0639B, partial [Vibrio parahaemolyticus 861]
HLSLLR